MLLKPGILLCNSCAKEQGSIDSNARLNPKSHVYLPENYKLQPLALRERQRAMPSDLWWLKFWSVCLSLGVSLLPVVAAFIYIRFRS